jgi:hypothetical protein
MSSDPENRHSVGGSIVKMNGAVIGCNSKMHKSTVLSITEGEFVKGADGVQDAIYGQQIIQSIGLRVKKKIVWKTDNRGAVDLVNSWTYTGRTRHIATKITFMRELKEEGRLEAVWIPASMMSADIFTKNVGGADFQRHRRAVVG